MKLFFLVLLGLMIVSAVAFEVWAYWYWRRCREVIDDVIAAFKREVLPKP